MIPCFQSETSGLTLIFAVLIDQSEGWRGVQITEPAAIRLQQLRKDPDTDWIDPQIAELAA